MNKTKIEYLDYTWNPLAMRCSPVSEGCLNCWHLAMAKRLAKNPMISAEERGAYLEAEGWKGSPQLRNKELEAPFHLKKPARIGVQFMGDLFHESVSSRFINSVIGIMTAEETGHHMFFILTKRPQKMRDYFKNFTKCGVILSEFIEGVYLGVSVEDQKTADERIPILLQIPAAKRFVSVEPMLGQVLLSQDWQDYLEGWETQAEHGRHDEYGNCVDCPIPVQVQTEKLDWVICGGETGPGARPIHPDWIRSLRDQCQASGVPFFFKGWGEWLPVGQKPVSEFKPIGKNDAIERFHLWKDSDKNVSMKIGHKATGRLLDGREWNETPCK